MRQSDLFSFAEGRGRSPPIRGYAEDHGDEGELTRLSPPGGRGRKCAKCGRPLNGGGLYLVGYGLVCWPCFQQGWGRSG